MRADADAFAAVNALVGCNNRFSAADADCLGRAVLDAVRAALALIFQ